VRNLAPNLLIPFESPTSSGKIWQKWVERASKQRVGSSNLPECAITFDLVG